jgi:uncharacterized membrane protein YgcG
MKAARGVVLAVCLVVAALAQAQAQEPLLLPDHGGLLDPAHFLSSSAQHEVRTALERLHVEHHIDLVVVIETAGSEGATAAHLLKTWPAARDEAALCGVLHLVLSTKAADVALAPALADSLPAEVRTTLVEAKVRPALTDESAAALAAALLDVTARLAAATAGRASATAVPVLPPPPPPPDWLNPLYWIVAPALIFALLVWIREGGRAMLALLPCLLLLYSGAWLMLSFRPRLFMGMGWLAAVAPVAYLATRPALATVVVRAVGRWCGGLGVTRFGPLGTDRLGRWP